MPPNGICLLGEAADPQIDVVDAGGGDAIRPSVGVGARAVEEVEAVGVLAVKTRSRRRYRQHRCRRTAETSRRDGSLPPACCVGRRDARSACRRRR